MSSFNYPHQVFYAVVVGLSIASSVHNTLRSCLLSCAVLLSGLVLYLYGTHGMSILFHNVVQIFC